ncbi:MAG: transglycosylase [Sphingomonas bacterium]|nr:transglycosylase [Sphingomonas bacterium]
MTVPALCAVALWIVVAPSDAWADVLEIGQGGAVVVRASDRGLSDPVLFADPVDPEPAPDVPAAAITTIEPAAVPAAFRASLAQAAETARVSPTLLAALVWQESRWRPAALSARGARGLTQLMPVTARALAVDSGDAEANLAGGARYLRNMLDMFDGNVERALAAYNAGPGRVLHSPGLPAIAETRAYVSSIIDRVGAPGATVREGATP